MDEESTPEQDWEPADPEELAERAERVQSFWDEVIADMEATAAEYREAGYDVVELHPGDVTPLTATETLDRWGLDLLVPDNEFAEVERLVLEENGSFDSCEVFRATAGDLVFLVVAMLEEDREEAIVFPAYYDPAEAEDMLLKAREAGEMRTHLRPLDPDPIVTFTQDDPSLFVP